ncbi:MAG: hypothetical protein MJ233_02835 [Mycoplasmoidaceae bacterium]|nr:hypothetical protein [Mycoplasmoidaceae bacterium]
MGDVKTLTLCLSLDNVDPINHTLSVSFDLLMTAEVDSLYTNEKMLYTIEKYFVFKNIE